VQKGKLKMKSHLFRASSILAVFALLAAFGLSGSSAQQPTSRPKTIEQQEPQLPELMIQQLNAETLPVAVPPECKGIKPIVQTHNSSTGVSPSAVLLSFMGTHARKGYNNPAVNTYFGDSFRLQNCRVCYATIEAKVQHYADIWNNDSLTVGVAPFGSSNVFVSGNIWPPNTNPTTLTRVVPAGLLTTYITTSSLPPKDLDVFAQDDTNFHSVTLSVWYY
jgi:hypothetical protein